MPAQIIDKDDQYLLNQCTRYLARDNTDPRHNFDQFAADDPRARILDAWRFPVIDSYRDGVHFEAGNSFNEVTFIFADEPLAAAGRKVAVLGTFDLLYNPLPMRQVGDSRYYALTAVVPKGEVHRYRFVVDGQVVLDPINPQTVVDDGGAVWSQFFTQECVQPVSFERWELRILDRLTDHILPFRTRAGQNFLDKFYTERDLQGRFVRRLPYPYLVDQTVGVANFIDKLVAREERHHLDDYKICLALVDTVLRQRYPFNDPWLGPVELFSNLYNELATGNVPGWDYGSYGNPSYFLWLLRRHTITGAFAHPKYGGNNAAAGWRFLADRYQRDGQTLFDWGQAQEPPLGTSPEYRG